MVSPDIELVKGIRRQNILREPTPPPIDSEEEDSATRMLKQRTRLAAALPPTVLRPEREQPASELVRFATGLNLNVADSNTIEGKSKFYLIKQSRLNDPSLLSRCRKVLERRRIGQNEATLWSEAKRSQAIVGRSIPAA